MGASSAAVHRQAGATEAVKEVVGALHLEAKAEGDNTLQLQMEDRATRSIQDVVAECSVLLVVAEGPWPHRPQACP